MTRKTLTLLAGLLLVTAPSALLAQSDECVDTTAISTNTVISNAVNVCKSTRGRRRKNAFAKLKGGAMQLAGGIGKSNARQIKNLLNQVRRRNCSVPSGTPQCSNDTAYTVNEIQTALLAGVCTAKLQSKRKAGLKKFKRGVKKLERVLDATLVASLNSMIDALLASDQCGAGGEKSSNPSQCKQIVKYRNKDLWKPVSDANGNPVFLENQFRTPSSCSVIKNSGQKIVNLRNTGPSNGRNSTWRVFSRRCTAFPNNIFVACKIPGQGTKCWKVPRACSRYE
ncbi:MAG: hypothetical protein D6719_11500 [Candidatus Dadabacteria bacterium]|nr:MAG: hypothetical protein D6719_11500 [Candidatus Dadabacteria bacterium]